MFTMATNGFSFLLSLVKVFSESIRSSSCNKYYNNIIIWVMMRAQGQMHMFNYRQRLDAQVKNFKYTIVYDTQL